MPLGYAGFQPMSTRRTGELTASIAMLGLLVQQPDTIANLAGRLAERFPNECWSRSSVHKNMPGLVSRGLAAPTEASAGRPAEIYEATSEGFAQFRDWLRHSTEELPALRDAVRARLELAEEQDLPMLLEAIREETAICIEQYERLRGRYATECRLGRLGSGSDQEFRTRVRGALLVDEIILWGSRIKRLQRLRKELEGHDEIELAAPQRSRASLAPP
jgi:DNA-binding PadR family transcriptional regulator